MPSCKILLSLTSSGSLSNEHEEAIQKLAKSGGIGPLVQAMKDLPCNLPLGLNVHLYSLILTMNSAIRSLNLRPFQQPSWPIWPISGLILSHMKAIRRPGTLRLLQRLAIAVLRNFLTAGDMNKTSAARAGAIPAMIMAMQRYKRNLQIQEEAKTAMA